MIKNVIIWSLIWGAFGVVCAQTPFASNATVDSLLQEIYTLNHNRPEGYQKGMAQAFCQIGKITYAQGEHEGAFSLLQKSLTYAQEATAYRITGNIHLELCQYYIDQENVTQAWQEAEEAEKSFQMVEDEYAVRRANAYKGLILYQKKEYQNAFDLLWNGLDRDQEKRFFGPALDCALKMKMPDKGLEILDKVLPFSLRHFQENLTYRQALIGYYVGDEEAYAYVLTPTENQIVPLGKTQEIKKVYSTYQTKYINKAQESDIAFEQKGVRKHFFQLSSWLYDLLWAPIERTDLLKNKSLIIVPDGLLEDLPFEALIKDKRTKPFHRYHYLIQDYEVRYYPAFIFTPSQAHPELVEKYQTYLAETPGSDEAQALRKARMKMIKSKSEYSNPWYWAIYKDED